MRPDVDNYYVILDAANITTKNVSIDYVKWEGKDILYIYVYLYNNIIY